MKQTSQKRPRFSLIRQAVTIALSAGVTKLLKRADSSRTRRRAALSHVAQASAPARSRPFLPQLQVATTYVRRHPGVVVGLLAAGVVAMLAFRRSDQSFK